MNEAAYLILLGAFLTVIVYSIRDGFLFWVLIRRSVGGVAVPVPGPATPPPVALPPPRAAVKPRFTGVTATSFGGAGDANASAYGGMVNPDAAGVALPYRFSGTRPRVRVFYNGKTVDCDIVDVGPWNINDPYWTTNSRPEAESGTDNSGRHTNLAGIDLTPAAWAALGDASTGKAKVDWDFVNVLDAAPTPVQVPAPVTPGGVPAWITLGRTFNGLVWSGGPMPDKLVAWMDNIVAKYPEMAPYCQALKNEGAKGWWAWCGFYVAAMLSYSGIRPPISAAGLKGDTTTADFAYVDAWRTWGTKVWDAADGNISNAQPQIGDVLVWNGGGIHHVSFYDHPEPTTDTFASLGGDQGSPLRVCIEDISMSYCVAIRRPPVS